MSVAAAHFPSLVSPAYVATHAAAGVFDDATRDRVLARLEASRRRLYEALRALGDAWGERLAPTRWSAEEIVEHLALTEWATLAFVRDVLPTASCLPLDELRRAARDAAVAARAADRSTPERTAERLRPGSAARDGAPVASFDAARDTTLEWVRTTLVPLRARALPHPALGMLDGVQWLLFLAGHTERHAAQVEEIGAALGRTPRRAA